MAGLHLLSTAAGAGSPLSGDTPVQRLLSLLERIAGRDRLPTLQELTEETGLPKPTVHRMLQQLEDSGMVLRHGDGRHYTTGARMRRLAEHTLLHDTHHGARHRVLQELVAELGESCNVTALSGHEVVYLDRVETAEPLRFTLSAGSRVPAHCSASGKMLLGQLSPAQRRRLLECAPLAQLTPRTSTDPDQVEAQVLEAQQQGFALDDEEFLPGLVCAAVLVPVTSGPSNLAVAVQAPALRLSPEQSLATLPALRRAAEAIARIDRQDPAATLHEPDQHQEWTR